ncbi:MAG: hypothetical protein JKY61_05235 [Planctomycetes bacterium]|nr:hypothetical protein [Planctomycetota bacterium]
MTESVYIVAEGYFAGDLVELSFESHVWVWLTPHNRAMYEAAIERDERSHASRCGLSGYEGRGDALESLHAIIGVVGEHHYGQATKKAWEEIWILGFASTELDASRMQHELEVGEIIISDEQGLVVIRRSTNSAQQQDDVLPKNSAYSILLQKLAFGWKRFSGR